MKYGIITLGVLCVGLLTGCETGIRRLDFESKQYMATYNVDSTKGLDSTNIVTLIDSKAIYVFSEDGKGMSHIQTGMLSKDTPFTWKVQNDSMFIDNKEYAVERQDRGFIFRSDSVKMFLSPQR